MAYESGHDCNRRLDGGERCFHRRSPTSTFPVSSVAIPHTSDSPVYLRLHCHPRNHNLDVLVGSFTSVHAADLTYSWKWPHGNELRLRSLWNKRRHDYLHNGRQYAGTGLARDYNFIRGLSTPTTTATVKAIASANGLSYSSIALQPPTPLRNLRKHPLILDQASPEKQH